MVSPPLLVLCCVVLCCVVGTEIKRQLSEVGASVAAASPSTGLDFEGTSLMRRQATLAAQEPSLFLSFEGHSIVIAYANVPKVRELAAEGENEQASPLVCRSAVLPGLWC